MNSYPSVPVSRRYGTPFGPVACRERKTRRKRCNIQPRRALHVALIHSVVNLKKTGFGQVWMCSVLYLCIDWYRLAKRQTTNQCSFPGTCVRAARCHGSHCRRYDAYVRVGCGRKSHGMDELAKRWLGHTCIACKELNRTTASISLAILCDADNLRLQ